MTDENVADNEETPNETPNKTLEDTDPNKLGVGDLNLMVNILDAVAQRGGIRANEMTIVGNLYTKLMTFLVESGARQTPNVEMSEQVPTMVEETVTSEGDIND